MGEENACEVCGFERVLHRGRCEGCDAFMLGAESRDAEITTLRADLAHARAEVERLRAVVGAARDVDAAFAACDALRARSHSEDEAAARMGRRRRAVDALRTALAALDGAGEGG